nr:ribonuclease HII [Lachnospiraceae bacterium]
MESISIIKEKFKDRTEEELRSLIKEYASDERAGVAAIRERAEKSLEALKAERERMKHMFSYERQYPDAKYICGIDEVGRGPFAGPVVACAVILPKEEECDILYLNDSKQVRAKMREKLSEEIKEKAVAYGIGIVDNRRIDEINILQATFEAMREAIKNLSVTPDILLNDAVT